MILINLIAGHCIVSFGDLSREGLTILLLGLIGHAPDTLALLNGLNEEDDDTNRTKKLISVLSVFTCSIVKFAVQTPGGIETKKEEAKSND